MTPWPRSRDSEKYRELRTAAKILLALYCAFWIAVATVLSWAVFG